LPRRQQLLRAPAVAQRDKPSAYGRFCWNHAIHRALFVRFQGRSAVIYWEHLMNGVIYLVGLIVVVMAILSFVGLR
jgi:hypothetical protein